MDMYIVLGVTIFLMIMFVVGKMPYGVITMTCCAILALTGVMSPAEAFSGLSNPTTLLIAGMLALATAFGKTSAVARVRGMLTKVKEKNGFAFLLALYVVVIILAQLMGRVACMSIMILFVGSMDDTEGMTASRLITAIFSVMAIWSVKFPIALGATMAPMANSFYEGIINDPALMLKPTDIIKVSFIPGIILLVYALFAWRLIPNTNKVDTSNVKDVKIAEAIPKKDEICITTVFVVVIVAFFFSTRLGRLMNIIPVIGILILLYTKSVTVKEVVSSMTSDVVWMVAGVLVVSSAIGSSGLGNVLGNFIQDVIFGRHAQQLPDHSSFHRRGYRYHHFYVQHWHADSAHAHCRQLLPCKRRRPARISLGCKHREHLCHSFPFRLWGVRAYVCRYRPQPSQAVAL